MKTSKPGAGWVNHGASTQLPLNYVKYVDEEHKRRGQQLSQEVKQKTAVSSGLAWDT